jgi:hypothetical protein
MKVSIIPHQKVIMRARLSCLFRQERSQKKVKFDFSGL